MLAIAFTFSCSGDSGSGGHHTTIKKEKISGVSQKGPFVKGTTVKIYELDANLKETGNPPFEGKTDDKGNFQIKITNGGLVSPYIVLEVKGSYISEVNGKQSTAPITLRAVADVSSKNSVNINVLTHLEYDKVLKLAKEGTKFEDAKKAAQAEVLNALGISENGIGNSEDMTLFGSNASDSTLLTASIILQADRSTDKVSVLLAAISNEISGKGTLSNSTKSEIANGVANLNMNDVKKNIQSLDPNAKVPSIDDINNIVEKIESSSSTGGNSSSSSSSEDISISSSSFSSSSESSSSSSNSSSSSVILESSSSTGGNSSSSSSSSESIFSISSSSSRASSSSSIDTASSSSVYLASSSSSVNVATPSSSSSSSSSVASNSLEVGGWTWFAFSDSTSTITMTRGSGADIDKITLSGNVTNGHEDGYAGLNISSEPELASSLKTAKSISFKVKGDGGAYRFDVITSDITDYSYYRKIFTAPSSETLTTINMNELTCPDWGECSEISFDKSKIVSIQLLIDEPGPFNFTISDFTVNQ